MCGTVLRALGRISSRSAEYLSYLEKGQLPPARISLVTLHEEFVVDGEVASSRTGSRQWGQQLRQFAGGAFAKALAVFGDCSCHHLS